MPEHSMQTMMPKLVDNQVASEKEENVTKLGQVLKLYNCNNVNVKQKLLIWSLTKITWKDLVKNGLFSQNTLQQYSF